MTEQERLEKAKAKSLAKHFKKAAAHHEGHAADDEKCEMAHKAHADAHEKNMGKADDAKHDYHKASAAFHKSMANFAQKMGKREKEYADHNKAMASACEENDAKKIFEIMEIEEEPVSTNDPVTKVATPVTTPVAAPAAAPVTDPAAALPSVGELTAEKFDNYLKTAMDKKLSESVDSAFERLLSSDDFSKRVDQEVAKKMLEKLGATTIDTPVKTFAIPRAGEGSPTTKGSRYEGIPEGLVDLVKSE